MEKSVQGLAVGVGRSGSHEKDQTFVQYAMEQISTTRTETGSDTDSANVEVLAADRMALGLLVGTTGSGASIVFKNEDC